MLRKLLNENVLNYEEIKKEIFKKYNISNTELELLEVVDTVEGDIGVWNNQGHLYLNYDNYKLEEPDNFKIYL